MSFKVKKPIKLETFNEDFYKEETPQILKDIAKDIDNDIPSDPDGMKPINENSEDILTKETVSYNENIKIDENEDNIEEKNIENLKEEFNEEDIKELIENENIENNENINLGELGNFNNLKFEILNIDDLKRYTEYDPEATEYDYFETPKFNNLVKSIEETGIQEALIVWETKEKNSDNLVRYIISGNHRYLASKILAEKNEQYKLVPCVIKRNITPTQARFVFDTANLNKRGLEDMTTYGKTKAIYNLVNNTIAIIKEKNKLLPKEQKRKIDLEQIVSDYFDLGKTQIKKYLRLYKNYKKEQIELIDKRILDTNVAYELSFIENKDIIEDLLSTLETKTIKIDRDKSAKIKEENTEENPITLERILEICSEEKQKQSYQLKVKDFKEFNKHFKNKSSQQISDIIKEALTLYYSKKRE